MLDGWLRERDAADVEPARRAELVLTCGCARGDAAALAAFDARFMPFARQAAARYGDAAFTDEVCQLVRRRLLVAEGGEPPRIAEYRGRGELAGFVRAVAVRLALRALDPAARKVHALGDDALVDVPAPADDPELAAMKLRYRGDFKQAFAEAVAALDDVTRTVLRLYYLDGLGLAELGRLHGWSVPTASRRLAAARTAVAEGTRQRLSERLELSPTELESLLRLIDSQLSSDGLGEG